MSKTRSRCGQRQTLSAFYKQAGGHNAGAGASKECFKAAARASWARGPKVQEGDRSSRGVGMRSWRSRRPTIGTHKEDVTLHPV
jgi:hypothetical protein